MKRIVAGILSFLMLFLFVGCAKGVTQAEYDKQAGVKYVEIIPERDGRLCALCSKVASKSNGIYPIDEASTLPFHPRCRCCYAPYVELDAAEYKAQEKVKVLQKSDKELEFYKRTNNHQKHAEEITGLTGDDAWYEYQKLASDFIKKDIDGIKVEGFVSKEGTLFKFDNNSDEFAILSKYGTISTYYTEDIY